MFSVTQWKWKKKNIKENTPLVLQNKKICFINPEATDPEEFRRNFKKYVTLDLTAGHRRNSLRFGEPSLAEWFGASFKTYS